MFRPRFMSKRILFAALVVSLLAATSGCGDRSAGVGAGGDLRGKVFVSSSVTEQGKPRALVEGMVPGCTVDIAFPKNPEDDVEFHPIDAGAVPFDAEAAFSATQEEVPADGMQGEVKRHADLFALLNRAFGCRAGEACDLSKMPAAIQREKGDAPSVAGAAGNLAYVGAT